MDTINISLSKTKLCSDASATTSQIKFLQFLCVDKGVDFPFSSIQECIKHLRKHEASKAIMELKDRGNLVAFIYPKD